MMALPLRTSVAPLLREKLRFWHRNAEAAHAPAVYLLLLIGPMQQSLATSAAAAEPALDIVFACVHCATSFVVDAAAAGVTLQCQNCNQPTTVPHANQIQAAASNALIISDLQHQLKENDSQRTEITGYINQLSIQLHRWQLRLKTLNERQQKLQSELAMACDGAAT